MKILIVDDHRENLLALEAVLNSPDYHVVSASSGEEALKCLLKDDFAVILLDVQMPGMDGFETASLIRARKVNKDTPIIFITATYQTTENMTQGYSLGAIDYLFKPFHPQTLKLKIEAFVKIHLREKKIRLQNELLMQRAVELETMNKSLERTTSDLRKAEALARVIGETATDTVITLDGVGLILNVNPALTEMFGYEHEELQGQHILSLFPSESLPFPETPVIRKSSKILYVVATHKDGTVFPVEVQIGVASIEDQQIFVWSVRDITERKQLEEERKDRFKTLGKLVQERTCELFLANETLKEERDSLRSAIERFSKAFQLGPHMMTITRKSDNRYVDVNRRFLEAKGLSREDVIGKTPTEIDVPESRFKQIIAILEAQGLVQNYEGSMLMKDGSEGSVIFSAETIQVDDQDCILVAYNDVTEMKRMQMERTEQLTKNLKLEEDVSRGNQLIADSINNMQDGFFALDDQWNFTYVNKKAEELFLKTGEELLDEVFWEVLAQARGTLFELNFQQAKNVGVPTTFESLGLIHKDTWFEVTAYPSQFGLSVYYRDITEQKLSREKLIKSQKETALILENMTDCFFALDRDGQFTHINRAAEIAFGKSRDALLGKKITEVFSVDDTALRHYHEVMNEHKAVTFEILSEALGNSWLEINAYPIETGLSCYFRDITSRKIADKEFARLERLNLVGQLAAGIGHEIRNPMTTVRGYLQLLGSKPEYEARKSIFDLMISELDRANAIITEFLSLARTKQTERKYQNLNDILIDLYPLLQADTFTQNKQIVFIPGEIPNLEINGNEITQLVLNLTRNGLEAMQEGGRLNVKSYVENGKVVLAIEDEGGGIPRENIPKIGTPFFTTKDTGTGLGLATCYKIAESHYAKIHIDSSSRGTTFYIFFPIPEKIA